MPLRIEPDRPIWPTAPEDAKRPERASGVSLPPKIPAPATDGASVQPKSVGDGDLGAL